MEGQEFDRFATELARTTSRREALRLAGRGTAAGMLALLGLGGASAFAQPGCRREGHPCEGNQRCCPGLVCRVTGPGNARRCAKAKTCKTSGSCSCNKDCCSGYVCKRGCCVRC